MENTTKRKDQMLFIQCSSSETSKEGESTLTLVIKGKEEQNLIMQCMEMYMNEWENYIKQVNMTLQFLPLPVLLSLCLYWDHSFETL